MARFTGILVVAAMAFGALDAAARDDEAPRVETSDRPDIVDLATRADGFETLVRAIRSAGLADKLGGAGPFTVFAPTDEAFAKLPEGTLEGLLRPENRDALIRVLALHVVAGDIDSVSALAARTAETLAGIPVEFRLIDGRLRVDEANVLANDIEASNGIVHAIDAVLLPPESENRSPEVAALDLLGAAIERGVPLFNDGQPAACAAVYEIAVRALVDLPVDLPEKSDRILRRALEEGAATRDPARRAWSLRYAIDEASLELVRRIRKAAEADGEPEARTDDDPPGHPRPNASVSRTDIRPVFTFDRRTNEWFAVNDNVMGGVSDGGYGWESPGLAIFSGQLSLENNGGFSTIRSRSRDLELEGFDGLLLRVRGDGRDYSFSAMTDDARSEIRTWRKGFSTEDGEWIEVRVPFADLRLTVMGRRVPGGPAIEPSDIRTLSFSIADKDESPFRLEIDWIRAYRTSTDT